MTSTTLPRMRTAEGALNIIKELDPDTAVTIKHIRYLINTGKIPFTSMGRKKLINVDLLLGYLSGEEVALPHEPEK